MSCNIFSINVCLVLHFFILSCSPFVASFVIIVQLKVTLTSLELLYKPVHINNQVFDLTDGGDPDTSHMELFVVELDLSWHV